MIKYLELEGVKVDPIPEGNKNRIGRALVPTSITIHETGNSKRGANAHAHASFLKRNISSTGWHFTVDEQTIIQHLPLNENAYHAGDGEFGKGNTTSIGIEICVNSDGDFRKAKLNTQRLIRHIMEETGIRAIVPHKHCSGKQCPRTILDGHGWEDFVNQAFDGLYNDRAFELIFNERNKYRGLFKKLKEDVEKLLNKYK